MTAAERWRDALRSWAIPEEILTAAPESPYGFPTELFRQRAEHAIENTATPTTVRALEALPEGGSVLDVGVGAGSTSLPLADRAGLVVGVDESAAMLRAFEETGRARGVRVETIKGTWPNAAVETRACDVVVCGHVLYNVQDLVPFLRALEDHARRRIVAEITAEHPWAWMNDLWRRFHDLERPTSPTAEDAVEVLRGMGFEPHVEERVAEPQPVGFERREDAIALIRRRMCLTAGRDGEVAEALGNRLRQTADLWSAGPATTALVTIWWDAPAGGGRVTTCLSSCGAPRSRARRSHPARGRP